MRVRSRGSSPRLGSDSLYSMYPSGGQQRGPLSDSRQGKARAEMLKGSRKGRLLVQVAFVLLTAAGVVALLAATALLTSESPTQRWWALGTLGLLGLTLVLLALRRRRNRQSLDEVLRSRRQ